MMLIRVALAVSLLLGLAVPTSGSESTFPDIQRVLDSGKLRVAILARDAPPMIMTDNKGAPIGFEVDHALDIGKKLGVDVELVRTAKTSDGVVDLVARKEADIAVSFLSSGVRRAKKVLLSKPYVTQSHRVFYNRARFAELRREWPVETIEQLAATKAAETLTVGVLEGTIYSEMFEEDLPGFPVRPYQTVPEIVAAVREGRIFAGRHGEVELDYYMRQNPGAAIYVAVEPTGRPDDIRIAVRPDAPNLLRWLNVYLDKYVGVLDSAAVIQRYEKGPAQPK